MICVPGWGRSPSFSRVARLCSSPTRPSWTRMRSRSEDPSLRYRILLKTVIMEQNLDELGAVARFATRPGLAVFYQPIEQNYNTAENPKWFVTSPTWPRHPEAAVRAVLQLIQLKRDG